MVTIKDIANRLGIAISTVSKGLNGANDISPETTRLILDTAVEMGYVSKRMRKSTNRKVCILIDGITYDNIDQFGYDIVMGFKRSAARRHWDVHVIPTNHTLQNQEKFDSYMLKHEYSGAFLLGFNLHDSFIEQLHKTTVPTVLFDNFIEDNIHVGYVGTDSFEGIHQAIHHLKKLGHQSIAFLNGTPNSRIAEQRHQAFVQSMTEYNLPIVEELIAYGYYDFNCAKEYVPRFIQHNATAILCASDIIASGVIQEVHKLGLKVPDDISVIGYDDLPIATALTPKLTTIRQDRIDLGKSAFLLLDGLINNVSISKLLLRAKLIERESTGLCKSI